MAEGQTAQGFVRHLLFPARPLPALPTRQGEISPPSVFYTPLLRKLDFWKSFCTGQLRIPITLVS
jgi:hypothetical protein